MPCDRMMMLAADDCADRTDALAAPEPPVGTAPSGGAPPPGAQAHDTSSDEYAAMADEAAERFGAELPDPARLRAMRAAAHSDAVAGFPTPLW